MGLAVGLPAQHAQMCLWDSGCIAFDRHLIAPSPHLRVTDCSSLPAHPAASPRQQHRMHRVACTHGPATTTAVAPGPARHLQTVKSLTQPTAAQSTNSMYSVDVLFRKQCDALQGEDDSAHEAKWLADLRKTVEACGACAIAQSSGAQFVTTPHLKRR